MTRLDKVPFATKIAAEGGVVYNEDSSKEVISFLPPIAQVKSKADSYPFPCLEMGSVNFGNFYPETPLLRHGNSFLNFTADDQQNVFGDPGATLGSMNMDDFLKNIWTHEESQAMASAINPVESLNQGLSTQLSLQKQGSYGLPRTLRKQGSNGLSRTLSVKEAEDIWKSVLSQEGKTEAASGGVYNHQRPIVLEDFSVKTEIGQERKPHVEVSSEDFLGKAGIVWEGPNSNSGPSNQGLLASNKPVPINQMHQVSASPTMMPFCQAHQGPTRPFLTPNQQQHGSVDESLTRSNQMKQQVSPVPTCPQSSPAQSSLKPLNLSPPFPTHQQTSPNMSSLVPGQVCSQEAFIGFGGFPISRNDGGFEIKVGQVAPKTTNSFAPLAANAMSWPPSPGKAQFDALNNMLLPRQQSEWINNPFGKSITHQSQLGQRQAIAESPSTLCSMANASNGPSVECSPGRLSPVGGGFGAALGTGGLSSGVGTGRGGKHYPARISFGPCSPLGSEFDDGSPEASNLPLSIISEFGNGQPQRKKRSADQPIERVIERRQRRMIKNRESAARSRARKQAYTVELEAEVSQLKEENLELLRKQEEEATFRKKQILAFMPSTPKMPFKGRSLKRTHTGPW